MPLVINNLRGVHMYIMVYHTKVIKKPATGWCPSACGRNNININCGGYWYGKPLCYP